MYRFLLLLSLSALSLPVLAQERLVAEFDGDGMRNTRPFTVSDGWEVRWNASGDVFQLYLHDAEGELVSVAANQSGSGGGASYQASGGRYYFQVNALGAWSLQIVDLDEAAQDASSGLEAPVEFTGSGASNTRPFRVGGPWELQWEARGDVFQVYLHDANGELVDVAANQTGAGDGASYQPRGGRYYLQVNALGAWTVRVVPVE